MKSIVDYTNKLKDFFASNTALTNVENDIAPVQNSLTAGMRYLIGDRFIYQGNLYVAETTIEQGDAIVIGGNCHLSEPITAITKSLNSRLEAIEPKVTGMTSGTFYIYPVIGKNSWVAFNLPKASSYTVNSASIFGTAVTLSIGTDLIIDYNQPSNGRVIGHVSNAILTDYEGYLIELSVTVA